MSACENTICAKTTLLADLTVNILFKVITVAHNNNNISQVKLIYPVPDVGLSGPVICSVTDTNTCTISRTRV